MVDYGYFSEFLLEKEEGELEEEKEVIIKDKFKGKKVRNIRFRENYIFLFTMFLKIFNFYKKLIIKKKSWLFF